MFGPSLIPRIEGDFSLRITDVIDRPDIRDEAQVMRWETKNSESTDPPSLLAQPCLCPKLGTSTTVYDGSTLVSDCRFGIPGRHLFSHSSAWGACRHDDGRHTEDLT